jgi:hypothetical protein
MLAHVPRILSEFVYSIDAMSNVPKGEIIFGSPRVKPGSDT